MSTGRQHKEPTEKVSETATQRVRRVLRTLEELRAKQLELEQAISQIKMKQAGAALATLFEVSENPDRWRIYQILLDTQTRLAGAIEDLQRAHTRAQTFWQAWRKLKPQERLEHTRTAIELATQKIAIEERARKSSHLGGTHAKANANQTKTKRKPNHAKQKRATQLRASARKPRKSV